jgi:Flp pilus assembly protein TadB
MRIKAIDEVERRMDEKLRKSGSALRGRVWLRYTFASTFFIFLLSAGACSFLLELPQVLLLSAILSAGIMLLLLRTPDYMKNRYAGSIERELPLALRTLAVELSVNLPFENCLRALSVGYGNLSKEFGKALDELEAGSSVPEALENINERVDSKIAQRALVQISMAYVKGGTDNSETADILKKMADELVSIQKSQSKQYTGKLAIYSLIFIAVSAVVPAIFGAFVIVGSSFMELSLTPLQALLIPVVLFPLVDIMVLVFIRSRRPRFV